MTAQSAQNAARCSECRRLRKSLESMTKYVQAFLGALDVEMRKPSSPERGKRIAEISNKLDMANDHIRYFDLGIDYRKDKKPKARHA